jgi:hypothetical protein
MTRRTTPRTTRRLTPPTTPRPTRRPTPNGTSRTTPKTIPRTTPKSPCPGAERRPPGKRDAPAVELSHRRVREEAGWSQVKVAGMCGTSPMTVRVFELDAWSIQDVRLRRRLGELYETLRMCVGAPGP